MSHQDRVGPDVLEELHALADKACDQTLTSREAARLRLLLLDNPLLQRLFLEHTSVHGCLQQQFEVGNTFQAEPEPSLWNSAFWSSLFRALFAPARRARLAGLALLLAMPIGLYFLFARVPPQEAAPLAVLKNAFKAEWPPQAVFRPGDQLSAGRFRLLGGWAAIQFGCGAVAIVEGPAELELLASAQAYLHSGQVVVHVQPHAQSFKLETPTARLLDLGTEFGVTVGAGGDTVVQVYQGKVLTESKQPKPRIPREQLEGGQALHIDDKQVQETPFVPERFRRFLPGPHDPSGRGLLPYNKSIYDTVHIVPAPAGIVIDGDLSDWDLSGRFRGACDPPYDEGYYLEGAMMYDARFLYLGGHVGDPFPMRSTVSPHSRRELYGNGGCVAFRLSTDRRLGWPLQAEDISARKGRPPNENDLNQKLVFPVLWSYQPEQLPCLHIRYGMDLQGVRVNPPGYQGAFRRDPDGKGYTFEYAISWSLLNAAEDPPQGGDVLAATWLAHWSGADGRTWKGQLVEITNPRESGWNFQRAATWGKAIYHRKGHLAPGTVRPSRHD
jgi:hypothetical protein